MAEAAGGAPQVTLQEFHRLDIRVAVVKAAEEMPGSDKLLRLRVDIGGEERQLIAGVKKFYPAAQLVGKRIVVLANLKPAKIFGAESQGMLLAAEGADGTIAVLAPDGAVGAGSKVR